MRIGQEVLRKAEKGLSQAIYELTWAGELWGRWGAIRLSRLRAEFLEALGESPAALSSLSSTYYTAFGSARALARQSVWPLKLFWSARAGWYLVRAARLSARFARTIDLHAMSAGELDVRSRILSRIGDAIRAFLPRWVRVDWAYAESLRCIEEALGRNTVVFADSRALLLMNKAEVLAAMGRRQESDLVYQKIYELLDRVKPTTSARLLRSLGVNYKKNRSHDLARSYFERALRVAREHHLQDQVLKIEAEMK